MADMASLLPSLLVYGLLAAAAIILIWKVRGILRGDTGCSSCSSGGCLSGSCSSARGGSCCSSKPDQNEASDKLKVLRGARK